MIFSRLLNLWGRKDVIEKNTPIENFTTEILVWLCHESPKVKKYVLRDFLNIYESDIEFRSQERIKVENEFIIPDIWFEGKSCFGIIENKIDSQESNGQLDRYFTFLDNESQRIKKRHICSI